MFFFFLQRTECVQYLISFGTSFQSFLPHLWDFHPAYSVCFLCSVSPTFPRMQLLLQRHFFFKFPIPSSSLWNPVLIVMGTEIRDNLDNFTLVQRGKFHSSELISCFGLDNDHFPSHSDKNICVIFNFFPLDMLSTWLCKNILPDLIIDFEVW